MCHTFWEETPEANRVRRADDSHSTADSRAYNNNMPRDRIEFGRTEVTHLLASARSINAYLGYRFTNVHATEASRYLDGHELFARCTRRS